METPGFTIYVDGWCPLCKKAGALVKKLDLFGLIRIEDIRRSEVPDEEFREKGLNSLASITPEGTHYFGFDSLVLIALRLPLLWVFLPLVYLLKWTGAGAFLYRELAIKRSIIPLHCGENCDKI